jgi:hypothetical protein
VKKLVQKLEGTNSRDLNMKNPAFVIAMFFAIIFLERNAALCAGEMPVKPMPVLKINKEYDKRTRMKVHDRARGAGFFLRVVKDRL